MSEKFELKAQVVDAEMKERYDAREKLLKTSILALEKEKNLM